MKASEKLLIRFLQGADKHFLIPVYQRNYDWKEGHCKQLFDDLISIIKEDFRSHFLGSIVSIYSDDGDQEYLIIDGQQRLITISILFLAIHNYTEKNKDKTQINPEKIKKEYLINEYSEGDKKIRLKPIKNDNNAFLKLFTNNEAEFIPETSITKNYQYFYNRISSNDVSIDDLFKAIAKLVIVDIELNRTDDDPQLIFESLNSTGLSLSQADLVRNYILMKENKHKQKIFYENYWNKIENLTNYKTDGFIRDYLTFKENSISNKEKVYLSFKTYVSKQKNDDAFSMESLLQELLQFAGYYNQIINNQHPDKDIEQSLKSINKLDITVSYPFLLEIFNDLKTGVLNENDVVEILKTLLSFSFRRILCEVSSNSLNKIFMALGKEIKKHPNYKENYVNIFKYILLNKKGTQRFPENIEFSEKFSKKDIYNLQAKNKNYLLERLENYDNKEVVDIENLMSSGDLTVEHIMPQQLSKKWQEYLGGNWQEIHTAYLNTIGNISLTGYNPKMSNKTFQEKRDMEKGFKDSRLLLNKYLQNIDEWKESQINQRAEILKDKALLIWEYPITNYQPNMNEENIYSLTDDIDSFTGEKIHSFVFMGDSYKAESWKDFYERILSILYELDPTVLRRFALDRDFNKISENENELRTPLKIADKLFIELNTSTQAKLSSLRAILNKYAISEDEVSIYLTDSVTSN